MTDLTEAEIDSSALPNFDNYKEIERTDAKSSTSIPSYLLPDEVKDFIVYFHRQLEENNTYEVQACYEAHFRKLTEKHFKDASWPKAELIAQLIGDDSFFLTLYKELYFRHIYQRLQPTIEHRFESYENYIDLFNYLIESDGPVDLELPNKWLWDMIDEFVYQFQSFTQYRAKTSARSADEIELLRDNPQIWDIYIVLNVLHSLIEKSNINEQLKAHLNGENPQAVAGEYGSRALYKMLGYFSLAGLLRLHTLLGDYHLALKVIENMELHKKGLYSRVAACQITVFHYVGFCYFMLRRYHDAIRSFTSILYFLQRTQSFHTRSSGYDMLNRKREQIFSLLALCITISPKRIDDSVQSEMYQRYGDKISRARGGDASAMVDMYTIGCPRFLSPLAPDDESPSSNAFELQLNLFKREMEEQKVLQTLRSYLKLYTTMSLSKLAKFLDKLTSPQSDEELRAILHTYKHKTTQLEWQSGDALSGSRSSSDDVDFYLDGDMLYISNVKTTRDYGQYFVRQISKFRHDKQ